MTSKNGSPDQDAEAPTTCWNVGQIARRTKPQYASDAFCFSPCQAEKCAGRAERAHDPGKKEGRRAKLSVGLPWGGASNPSRGRHVKSTSDGGHTGRRFLVR